MKLEFISLRHCTTTTWKYLISRLVEDLKTRLYFSFPEHLYSLLEFNSPKKFANIWRIERNGIYKSDYVSNRGPPFDFKFSDVFVAVAVFVINLPINRSKAWKFYLLFLFQNCWTLQGLEPAVVTSRLVTIFACYRCSVSSQIVYFTIVCQMNITSTDKITKAFIVNANVVSLQTIGHSKI